MPWYFDGSGGCAKCGAMTGLYLNHPGRPHPNCNCKIEYVESDCKLVYDYTERELVETIEVVIGPGSRLNSEIVEIWQIYLWWRFEKWECIDPSTGNVYYSYFYDYDEIADLWGREERILV